MIGIKEIQKNGINIILSFLNNYQFFKGKGKGLSES